MTRVVALTAISGSFWVVSSLAGCAVTSRLDESAFQGDAVASGGADVAGTGGGGASTAAGAGAATGGTCLAGSCAGSSGEMSGGSAGGENRETERGLVLHYTFDEQTGTVAHDGLREANNAIVHGGASWLAAGKVGGALRLAGSQAMTLDPQYVELPIGIFSQLDHTTVATWVRWEGGMVWQRVFDFGSDTGHSFFLTPEAGPSPAGATGVATTPVALLGIRPTDAAAKQVHMELSPTFPLVDWVHFAVTWGSGSVVVYVNGQIAGATPMEPWAPAPGAGPRALGVTPNNFIGRSQSPSDPYLSGAIDDFRVYDRELSQAEVAAVRDLGQ